MPGFLLAAFPLAAFPREKSRYAFTRSVPRQRTSRQSGSAPSRGRAGMDFRRDHGRRNPTTRRGHETPRSPARSHRDRDRLWRGDPVGHAGDAHHPEGRRHCAIPVDRDHLPGRRRDHRDLCNRNRRHPRDGADAAVVPARHLRTVRVSRSVFRRAETGAAGGSRPDRLAVGAAHRAAVRLPARRDTELAAYRRRADGIHRGRSAGVRQDRRVQRPSRCDRGLQLRVRQRGGVGDLLGDVAQDRGGAERERGARRVSPPPRWRSPAI